MALSSLKHAFLAAVLVVFGGSSVTANTPAQQPDGFEAWKTALAAEARSKGVPQDVLDKTLGPAVYVSRVIERDRRQAEFSLTFWRYLDLLVNEKRVKRGQAMLAKHGPLLEKVAAKYGVQPRFLMAFWGVETNFGGNTGDFPLISSLATLAFDPRRAKFFRAQLLSLLQLMGDGHIPLDAKGSWAGAMGNMQFIPTTYEGFATDFDGDGKRDMWTSLPDVFASASNYLSKQGWQGDRTWGREVQLPKGFDFGASGLKIRKPLAEWQALGIRRMGGRDLPKVDVKASLVLPAGANGPAFLVYQNFRSTMIWNRSIFYAIAVGHLADRIGGGPKFLTPRPAKEIALSRTDIKDIQRLLTERGFDTGGVDGIAGAQTRAAIRAFQKQALLPADGFPSAGLLERLRGS